MAPWPFYGHLKGTYRQPLKDVNRAKNPPLTEPDERTFGHFAG